MWLCGCISAVLFIACHVHSITVGSLYRLPESSSPEEFFQHLLNHDDLVTEDETRWKNSDFPDVPSRFGKLKLDDLESFDANFFQIHGRQAEVILM